MDEITLPYHLQIPAIISAVILLLIFIGRKRLFRKKYRKWFWGSTTFFFSLYLLIMGLATHYSIHSQWTVNQYDFNGDITLTDAEITPKQIAAERNRVSEEFQITASVVCVLIAGFFAVPVFIFGCLIEYFGKQEKME